MTNIPAKLVAEFATISNRIEEAIRQDERHKVLTQLATEREAGARAFLDAVFADRNGEQTSGAAKSVRQRRGFHSGSKLGKLYRCLASRTYAVTKNTLMRETGMTTGGVYQGIAKLRGKGYKIDAVFGNGSKARYKLVA